MTQDQQPKKPSLTELKQLLHLTTTYIQTWKDEDRRQLIDRAKDAGITAPAADILDEILTDMKTVRLDKNRTVFADKILMGGLVAIDLVILQALLSFTSQDLVSILALSGMGLSLVCAGGFLFLCCLRYWHSTRFANRHPTHLAKKWRIVLTRCYPPDCRAETRLVSRARRPCSESCNVRIRVGSVISVVGVVRVAS